MTADKDTLERWDGLPALAVARDVVRAAWGLEVALVTAGGPLAHQKGAVLAGSCEACRTSLFSPEGFAKCDAFYRELGAQGGERTGECHLGLRAVSVPVVVGDVEQALLVASGFASPELPVATRAWDPARVALDLRALDPSAADPASIVRALPLLRPSAVASVRAALRVMARELAAHEESLAVREGDRRGALPGMWGMVGASPRMKELYALLPRVTDSLATVLITGESGTGKELVARALHAHGPRKGKPFVAQSCGAMPEDLLESTLFGHVRGAFSGAVRGQEGVFAAANGGTLFLDEVGEMSPAMQVKLLRVLEDRTYLPVGATEPKKADVRVVAATHRDLPGMVSRGELREDLYYRLHVVTLEVPALRDRPGDVLLLVRHFLAKADGVPPRASDAALAALERYGWPGNVRELFSEVTRWAVTAQGATEVGVEHLSPAVRGAGGLVGDAGGELGARAAAGEATLAEAVESLERAILTRGLERTGGHRARLAKELGISRTTLLERLKRYKLE